MKFPRKHGLFRDVLCYPTFSAFCQFTGDMISFTFPVLFNTPQCWSSPLMALLSALNNPQQSPFIFFFKTECKYCHGDINKHEYEIIPSYFFCVARCESNDHKKISKWYHRRNNV